MCFTNSMLNYTVVIKKNTNFVELNENAQLYLGWEIPIVDVKVNDPIKSYSWWEFSEFGCLTYEVKSHFDVNFLCKKLIV